MTDPKTIENAYAAAAEQYARFGVETDGALATLCDVPVSMHCWQGDDVGGFENPEAGLGGGLQATGNYPGKARTPYELRADADKAFSLIPGKHRLNLHAIYLDCDRKVERNDLLPEHFASWVDWAREREIGLDFNGTFFSHPLAESGFTLAHPDPAVRRFWVEHGIACRRIGAYFGRELSNPCVTNVWIPDGYKDTPADRLSPRKRLIESLDAIFAEKLDPSENLDSVESKLFGIGSESYVVGSHEFYLGYAVKNGVLLCLDAGHFHPTETITDKISAALLYLDEILLHVSRGVRWDSDHVITFDDDLRAIAREIVRGKFLDRVHIGLDYFDASINRVAAWVIGMRNMIKALLLALLDPIASLRELEAAGDYTGRLALMEEIPTLPFGAVWDYYCLTHDVPLGLAWLQEVTGYEKTVLLNRG